MKKVLFAIVTFALLGLMLGASGGPSANALAEVGGNAGGCTAG